MSCLSEGRRLIKNYLVVSATAQQSVLHEAIQCFKNFGLSGAIVTKLDEATSLGEVLSTLVEHEVSVAYTTDGQKIPEDIRVARAHHLISKMVWLRKNRQQAAMEQATIDRFSHALMKAEN